MDKSLLHSLFHNALKYLVILTYFEYLIQISSIIDANSCVILSSDSQSGVLVISMHPTLLLSLLTNSTSSLLFLIIVYLLS